MSYPIPKAIAQAAIEIKKSRFIAYAKGIQNRAEGIAWLVTLQEQYPDARHHCWAYLLGNPSCATNAGMGDDGEPSGTAGKPILNVLQHKGVGDVMIVVVRYFGGIKLGAGGLTRAYGQAAQAVMEVLETETQIPTLTAQVACGFSQEQQIRHLLGVHQGEVLTIEYAEGVVMHIQLPSSELSAFQSTLAGYQCSLKIVV